MTAAAIASVQEAESAGDLATPFTLGVAFASPSSGDTCLLLSTNEDTSQNPVAGGVGDWASNILYVTDNVFVTGAAYWHKADGTEGTGDATIDFAGATACTLQLIQITGADDPVTNPPEAGTPASALSDTPDPPSLTPSGGSADYLYVAVAHYQVNSTFTSGPSGYSTRDEIVATGFPATTTVHAALGVTASTTEDPDVFTNSVTTNRRNIANTIAVYPGASSATYTGALMLMGVGT